MTHVVWPVVFLIAVLFVLLMFVIAVIIMEANNL